MEVNGDHQDHHPHHPKNKLEEREEEWEVRKVLEVGCALQEGSHQIGHLVKIRPLGNQDQTNCKP